MDNVFLSVPTRGQIQWQTVTRLEEIRDAHPGMRSILYQEGNLSVAMTRNKIVKQFLATNCDVLVMVDDDTVPSPHFLESVVPIPEGFGMVGLPYPTVNGNQLGFTAYRETATGMEFVPVLENGWNECDALGTGCVAISREAIVVLGENPFRIENDPDVQITSDDFLFCGDLRSAGYKIGCWWDGWYADHIRAIGLAPLMESILRERKSMTGAKK